MKNKLALVFAGAGASAAVDRLQYPATTAFYERLPKEIKSQDFIKTIEEWIRNIQGLGNSPVDVEVVLWALEELESFLVKLGDAKEFPFFAPGHNYLMEWTKGHQPSPMPNMAAITGNFSRLVQPLRQLRAQINERVYEFYAQLPTLEQLDENWLLLLEGLRHIGLDIELATTNYDLVLETALELLNWDSVLNTGRPDKGVYRYLDLDVWRNPLRPGGVLTKLHGSVDWSYTSERKILVGNPQFKADHSRHAIIYPGFKGIPKAAEMVLFHNYFAQAVSSADLLLFIGFAFRDEYLNRVLQNNVQPDATVLILNPAEALSNVPFKEEQVTYVKKFFDHESVRECLEMAASLSVAI
jgi:hypothetical protein